MSKSTKQIREYLDEFDAVEVSLEEMEEVARIQKLADIPQEVTFDELFESNEFSIDEMSRLCVQ